MHRPLIAAGVLAPVLALALAGCGKKPEGEKGAAGSAASTETFPAAEFAPQAAFAEMFSEGAAKIAVARAQSPEVKAFAEAEAAAHAKADADLKAAVGPGVALPPALTSDRIERLKALEGVGGADFDEAYLDGQISAHTELLDLLSRYAQAGTEGALKDFASAGQAAVQAELGKAQALEGGLKK